MAHSEVPAEKIDAYCKTDYRFGEGLDAVILRIDERSHELTRLHTLCFKGLAHLTGWGDLIQLATPAFAKAAKQEKHHAERRVEV